MLLTIGCDSRPSPTQNATSAPTGSSSGSAVGQGSGSAAVVPPPKPSWQVTFSSRFGLCEETPTRPCAEAWSVEETGPITWTQNFAKGDQTKTIELPPDERIRLDALVATPAFRTGIAKGFPCSQPMHDVTMYLSFSDRVTGSSDRQHVEACLLAKGPTNEAKSIIDIIRKRP